MPLAMKHLLLGTFISLALTSGGAAAQESADTRKSKPFTGLYFGVEAGYASAGSDSGAGNFYTGLRFQTDGGYVFGVEGAIAINDTDLNSVDDEFDFAFLGTVSSRVSGRFGRLINDRAQLFVGAGYDFGGSADNGLMLFSPEDRVQFDVEGPMFEVGVEHMFTNWFGVRATARYVVRNATNTDLRDIAVDDLGSVTAGLHFSF